MSEVDAETQVAVALTLEEKITDRVRKALVEVLNRGAGDGYVQDMLNQRIRQDISTLIASDWQMRENLKTIIKQTISEQMNKY